MSKQCVNGLRQCYKKQKAHIFIYNKCKIRVDLY